MKERAVSFATLVGLVILGFVLALAILEAGLGRHGSTGVILAYHDGGGGGDCDWDGNCGDDGRDSYRQEYGNRGDQSRCRGENCRGSFSPGPFDRSPLDFRNACISLDCSGRDNGSRDGEPDGHRSRR